MIIKDIPCGLFFNLFMKMESVALVEQLNQSHIRNISAAHDEQATKIIQSRYHGRRRDGSYAPRCILNIEEIHGRDKEPLMIITNVSITGHQNFDIESTTHVAEIHNENETCYSFVEYRFEVDLDVLCRLRPDLSQDEVEAFVGRLQARFTDLLDEIEANNSRAANVNEADPDDDLPQARQAVDEQERDESSTTDAVVQESTVLSVWDRLSSLSFWSNAQDPREGNEPPTDAQSSWCTLV